MGTVAVLGAGPGLGMSIAHRFGREGHRIALVSRSAERHPGYLAELGAAGIEAEAFVADVRDRERLVAVLTGIAPEVLYYGPAALDPADWPKPITEADSGAVRHAMSWVYAAVDAVGAVLPGMTERGRGGILLAGGLSAVVPMPALGNLALSSAALRNYAITLHAALAEQGVYAGTLTIGGLIERGDIHRFVGAAAVHTLNPDDIAETAWEMYAKRERAETVFNALGS
ncbi:SDR family NAD(P)-dependent oxidoreductase [Paractinoplanes rishiriensis]|uniref:Short-chain dehydrogenase n=1 Tax=Paractinoplanes rishiriensis TaxID=1050105 RepID=A0A919MWN3_9ACTN|nr:SDR family NAD(P)-dependent oxidoreductase [Actinoplanes rishiriensis]GIE97644.1 short-chain dehydrogenase [Actinoplanes rishiriensis]